MRITIGVSHVWHSRNANRVLEHNIVFSSLWTPAPCASANIDATLYGETFFLSLNHNSMETNLIILWFLKYQGESFFFSSKSLRRIACCLLLLTIGVMFLQLFFRQRFLSLGMLSPCWQNCHGGLLVKNMIVIRKKYQHKTQILFTIIFPK